jgi:hypothetical protein
MQTNFGIDGMMFDAETVMIKVRDDEPIEAISITPTDGSMVGYPFTIGNFTITGVKYENGDGQVKFDVSFINVPDDENESLVIRYKDVVNQIAYRLIADAMSEN